MAKVRKRLRGDPRLSIDRIEYVNMTDCTIEVPKGDEALFYAHELAAVHLRPGSPGSANPSFCILKGIIGGPPRRLEEKNNHFAKISMSAIRTVFVCKQAGGTIENYRPCGWL